MVDADMNRLASSASDSDLAHFLQKARNGSNSGLGQLLESFRRDRTWNEQAARKQLLQLFDAWGPKDPFTLEGRRKLSSMLFS